MNIAVVGSREFPRERQVRNYVRRLCNIGIPASFLFVSGGADGVDTWGLDEARKSGARTRSFLPEWDKYGKSAGFKRNALIVQAVDLVVVFWDGTSKGSKHDIDLALKYRKNLEVHFPNE